jgi:hypothetical protein
MKSVDKTYPTKEEIKTARAVMRKVFAKRLAKYKRRRFRRVTDGERDFYTWTHDMRILLQSSARDVSLSPAEIAARARAAADSIATLIAERSSVQKDAKSRRLRSPEIDRRLRRIWEEMFDSMIHEMAAKSEMLPHVIVDRARRIADAAMPHLKRRAKS